MPKAFLNCIKRGGRVRSKRVNKSQYIKVCYLNGKSYSGETHTYKKLLKKRSGIRYRIDKKLPYYGEADVEKKIIKVNPKKGGVVNTAIHEDYHIKHPKMSEKNVRKHADILERKMPVARQIRLMKNLV